MELNKDYLIYLLAGIIVLLARYIIFEEPAVKEVVKTKLETVVEDKIVYRDKECPKYIKEEKPLDTPATVQEEIKEYVLSSTSDVSHRYTISLFTYDELPIINSFKKIVLNGKLKDNEIENIFIMDVNQESLNNLKNVYFKVIDNQEQKTYINHNACLYNTVANFIYKTDLEISGDEVVCSVSEDRELEGKARDPILGEKLNENMKNTFLKMDSSMAGTSK